MDDKQIQEKLREFEKEVFGCNSIEDAVEIDKRLRAFIREYHLTDEQMKSFDQSGAGDMLGMIVCAVYCK